MHITRHPAADWALIADEENTFYRIDEVVSIRDDDESTLYSINQDHETVPRFCGCFKFRDLHGVVMDPSIHRRSFLRFYVPAETFIYFICCNQIIKLPKGYH